MEDVGGHGLLGFCQRLGHSCSFLSVKDGMGTDFFHKVLVGKGSRQFIDFPNCGLRLNLDMRTDFDGVLIKFIWLEFGQLDVV